MNPRPGPQVDPSARRAFLKILGSSAVAAPLPGSPADAAHMNYRIGACDWSLGTKQDIAAFDVAAKIGLEGLQVSFSTAGTPFDLRDPAVRNRSYQRVADTGIQIASLGMGILNQRPLATEPEAIGWVEDVVDVMVTMRQEQPDKAPKVCLLAFFGKGDINGKPDLMDAVTRKLKTVAGKAEDHGVILGIESLLSADDHLRIIDGVGSPAIQVYYDVANSNRMGHDIYQEILQIGGERICEVHCKENRALLGAGVIDFPRVRQSLDGAGFSGWLIIEGAMPKGGDVSEAYTKNFAFLDQVFRD